MRGLLSKDDYRPQFSGHETFPLRQLWLRKAYEAVAEADSRRHKSIFADADAIARFGVGKNMVSAIRHWALACDVLAELDDGRLAVGRLGESLFGRNGLDPFLEHPASAWLVHWHLAGEGRRSTTWYWLFNHVSGPVFERDDVVKALSRHCEDTKRGRSSMSTLTRDVDTCLRSYAPRIGNTGVEEIVESVLGELGLVAHVRAGEYMFRTGRKPSLPDGVLIFALTRFWLDYASAANTLSVETIAYEPGAPGPVFKLDLDSLSDRLASIELSSSGAFAWSETAGLKQLIRRRNDLDPFHFLKRAYETTTRRGNDHAQA